MDGAPLSHLFEKVSASLTVPAAVAGDMLAKPIGLAASVVGILILPIWLLGLGSWYCTRYFASLECVLCEKSLLVGRGLWFRVEKTIPLEKIQDLTLRDGPLLKAFGLSTLNIETAGQSRPDGQADANLIGIVDARAFRDRVLDQRDLVSGGGSHPAAAIEAVTTESLLTDIRDSLGRIEAQLTARGQSGSKAL